LLSDLVSTGSGWVEQIGKDVSSVKIGDPVMLSFQSCGTCYSCEDGHPAYCTQLFALNFQGEKGVYRSEEGDDFDIGGSFFGQSSFGSRAIVKERCLVNVRGLGMSKEELRVLAPLGCGIQTGTAAFLNVANVQSHHDVAVLGVGGVGQSAIMAAAMRGCKTIIAIDRNESRLRKATEFGATHTLNTTDESVDLVAAVRNTTDGRGVHAALDTTGVQSLANASWAFVRNHGKVLQVGHQSDDAVWNIPMIQHMNSGKQIVGVVQGDAIPQHFVPQMIEWYRQGKLPIDKLVSQYSAKEYQRALKEMRAGIAIKPVLIWPEESADTATSSVSLADP
jgi:Zn-dependent alcohol dehydrogenase